MLSAAEIILGFFLMKDNIKKQLQFCALYTFSPTYFPTFQFIEFLKRGLTRNWLVGYKKKMGWMMGLEPTTTGTTIRCSAIELHPPHIE